MHDNNAEILMDIQGLKKYFPVKNGLLHAVDNVSFRIPKGKTLGVVGESGCGKSTLGRTVLRLLEPTQGKILYRGQDLCSLNRQEMNRMRSKINIIFQDPYSSLDPRMTVIDSICEPLLLCNICKNKKEAYDVAREMMQVVGIASRFEMSFPHELDGGRRQRVGIARTLSVKPEFIVCDEPVSALDVSIQAQILNLLMDLQEEKELTYLFISHNMSVVKHISHEIMVMYRGICVEYAPKEELFLNPVHPYTRALLDSMPDISYENIGKELPVLQGEIASAVNPERGCRFAGRCPYCTAECKDQEIPLKEISPGHLAACLKA